MSFFSSVDLLPEDPILGLQALFNANTHPNKVNLGIGSYKDARGQPCVLSCVQEAEKAIGNKHFNKEYLPIIGNPDFNQLIAQLIFADSPGEHVTVQTVGGTGALRIAGEFIARNRKMTIYLPDPSWANHAVIFKYAGMETAFYPYYDQSAHNLNFNRMCDFINTIPYPAAILFHASCHNPTGIDPSHDQWRELSDLVKKRKLIPVFDMAYQGLGNGLDDDAFSIRHFMEEGHEMFVAQSCSKNFGLYGERIGSLSFVSKHATVRSHVLSHFKQIVRSNYSMPPLQGSRIVAEILKNPELTLLWKKELAAMRDRIKEMRRKLVEGLIKAEVNQDVRFFETQKGIFSYSGLSKPHVKKLRQEYGIFLTDDGRINVAGLNDSNIDYVVASIHTVMSA